MVAIRERDLKITVSAYLQYKMNAGELYYDRLNSGEVVVMAGQSRRRIKLCVEGTADFVVLQKTLLWDGVHATRIPACRTIFLELKSAKGRQTPEQGAFQKLVEMQGASYFIIHSFEQLQEIIP